MIHIEPSKLIGRQYYTHDQKTTYTAIGYAENETLLIIGEYPDPTYKCNRLATHKLSDCKFLDFVPVAPPPAP